MTKKIVFYLALVSLIIYSMLFYYHLENDKKVVSELKSFNVERITRGVETFKKNELLRYKKDLEFIVNKMAQEYTLFLEKDEKSKLEEVLKTDILKDDFFAIKVFLDNKKYLSISKKENIDNLTFIKKVRVLKNNQTFELYVYYDNLYYLSKLDKSGLKITDDIKAFNNQMQDKFWKAKEKNFYFSILFFIALFLFAFLLIDKLVRKPLQKLEKGLLDFFEFLNNKTEKIDEITINTNDEFGHMAKSLNNNIKTTINLHEEINNLNFNLEEKVKEKTEELRLLNESLESKIKKELEKNSYKDNLIFQQSKLASMGEMIGNIAHQWRQPLHTLGLIVQSFKFFYEQDRLNDNIINTQTEKAKLLLTKMSTTIDDFRNFFNPNKEKSKFNIDESINRIISLINASYKYHQIDIIKDLNCDIKIKSYQGEFEQVLLNIFQNAKDALINTKNDYLAIQVKTYMKDDFIFIEILDNAGGIKKKYLNKIFEPYFTTKQNGTGIGLFMSKQIIFEHMKGELLLENKTFQLESKTYKGASFIIKLKKRKKLQK